MTNTTPTRRESDNGIELERGRRAPYTQLGDWIALAPISHAAARLYHLLAAHLNKARGDSLVWPSRGTLAAMMRYSRPDKIDPLLKQLEDIGAIDVQRGRRYPDGSPAPNLYVVHETPPPGYGGEPSIEHWYDTRKEERQQRLAARAGGSQGSPEKRATPSPEKRATPSPEKRALTRRRELDEVEPASPTPPRQAAGSARATAAKAGRVSASKQPQQPKPRQAAAGGHVQEPTPTRAAAPVGSGSAGDKSPTPDPAAVKLVDTITWPPHIHVDSGSRRNLISAASRCLAAGWPAAAVQAEIEASIPRARSVGPAVRNLCELADRPRRKPVTVPQRTPWWEN